MSEAGSGRAIEIQNVSFTYPTGQQALQNVSLSVATGERLAIVGQNGAGKTTLAKLMNGLLRPTEGDVFIQGANTKTKTAAQLAKRVGYVFQNPDDQLFNNTVRAEIAFAPKVFKLDTKTIAERVAWAAELSGVTCHLNENPYNLPLSIRKFVTIASVLALAPDIVLLDEPTAGQDLPGILQLKHIIETLSGMGKTVLTITHDMEFAAECFPRTVVMANMKKLDDGDTADIFWRADVLAASALTMPAIGAVSRALGREKGALTVDAFVLENLTKEEQCP